MEEWRAIIGWEGLYEVSNLGRARSLDRWVRVKTVKNARLVRGRLLKGAIFDGYIFLHLREVGRSSRKPLHTAVAEAFIGPRPDGMEVCHNDGNRQNASADNLRYATRAQNHADMIQHGTHQIGERHPMAILNEQAVVRIRNTERRGGYLGTLAKEYGVTPQAIHRVVTRKSWAHVA